MEAITLAQTSHGMASTRDEMVGVLMLDAAVMVLMYAPFSEIMRCKEVTTEYTEWPFSLKGLENDASDKYWDRREIAVARPSLNRLR
jgi:hypothetical protein